MYYKIYQDAAGEWRWVFYAANHEPIAVSSEGYHNEGDCLHAIDLVKRSSNASVRKR